MMRLVALCLALGVALGSPVFDLKLDEEWTSFKRQYNKAYIEEEETLRRLIWEQNVQYIQKHNLEADRGLHTFILGINEYADMTSDEFQKVMNGYIMKSGNASSGNSFMAPSHVTVPDSVDWRTEGYVTEVKNQRQCGSCWSFSATGSLEGQTFKKTGKLVSLSEQNLVDCSRKEGNLGCEGGLMDRAFEYIQINQGIDTEASYPYKARASLFCHFKRANVGATDTGYTDITPKQDENALKTAVATVGPISVAMDASQTSFHLYKSGIYRDSKCSSTRLDHGVLAVGYGSESDGDYWIVKNSWGKSWGMNGYFNIARNENNMCGLASQASYPNV